MRLILLILLLCSFGADAQMIIKAHANYRPYAQPTANLLLDDYPGAAAAYSLRKLDKDYAGACMRIRRNDNNQETDIGFVNNYLDTTAIKNFTGSGTSAVVVTWYDQSGSGRNASQSVAANQPTIMVNNFEFGTIDAVATSEKAIIFNQSNVRLISDFSTISQPISVFAYIRKDNVTTAAAGTIYDSYNNTQSILYYTGTSETTNNRWMMASGTGLQGTTAGNTNPNLFSTLHNGASSSIHINGQSYVSGNAGTNGLNGLSIGNLRGNPSPLVSGYVLNGRVGELIIYPSNQSTNRSAIENNINDYYNIYWNGDFTGILDTYPNSAAAYSLRNLSSTYKGPLIRVRRSNDNAEQDIFGDYYGNLDTIGLKNFVGANNGFVTTWYDQSGSSPARNATQATAANQPRIINAGVIDRTNSKPVVNYGTNAQQWWHNLPSGFLNGASNLSYFQCAKINDYTNSNAAVFGPSNSFSTGLEILQHTVIARRSLLRINNTLRNDNSLDIYQLWNDRTNTITSIIGNSTSLKAYRNSNELTLTNSSAMPSLNYNGVYAIGMYAGAANNADMNMSELIIYTSDQTSNRAAIEDNLNNNYLIYNKNYSGLLDTYTGSALAYSLRQLSSTYRGPLIKIRRSNDNAEAEISFDYSGELDTLELKNFVGSNSAFIVAFYDQSGNNRIISQSTAASQARIVNAGTIERINGKVSAYFTDDSYNLSSFNINGTFSLFSAFRKLDSLNSSTLYSYAPNSTTGGAWNEIVKTTSQDWQLNDCLVYGDGFNSGESPRIITNGQFLFNNNNYILSLILGSTSTLHKNNTEATYRIRTTGAIPSQTNTFVLGGASTYYLSEFVLYMSDKSTDRIGIQNKINNYYGFY